MTSFLTRIRPSVQAEFDSAASAEAQGHYVTAFQHLERAHVIGQPSTVEHVRVHWRMFRFALRNRRPGEAYGQAWRLAAASVFTPMGLVPTGNTGGADVSGIRRMAIPEDLQAIIDASRGEPRGAASTCTCIGDCACTGICNCTATGDRACGGDCSCTARNQQAAAHADSCSPSCRCALASGLERARGQATSWTAAGATRAGAPVLLCQCADCSCA